MNPFIIGLGMLAFGSPLFGIANGTSVQTQLTDLQQHVTDLEKRSADSHYRDILEKTNQQLSNAWTPVNLALGFLGILAAFLGIGTAIGIHRQGSDFKKAVEADRKAYRDTLDSLVHEQRRLLESQKQSFNEYLENSKKTSEEIQKNLQSATEEERTKIQGELNRLALERADISNKMATTSVSPGIWSMLSQNLVRPSSLLTTSPEPFNVLSQHKCTNCKTEFARRGTLLTGFTPCPTCGNLDPA